MSATEEQHMARCLPKVILAVKMLHEAIACEIGEIYREAGADERELAMALGSPEVQEEVADFLFAEFRGRLEQAKEERALRLQNSRKRFHGGSLKTLSSVIPASDGRRPMIVAEREGPGT
jgi:hypothetical protein